ncbi:MAG: butyrate kinase [Bacilli bacterium]
MKRKILALNPGSTSTKIAVYEETTCVFTQTLRHSNEELEKFDTIFDQYEFRKNIILQKLDEAGIKLGSLSAIVGRGGMFKPIPSGTYIVNKTMLDYVKVAPRGEHASNLGCVIAREIADAIGVEAYIVDPVAVDEMLDIAKVTGMPEFPRDSLFHALNQKAVAKRYAKEIGKNYNDMNLIVAHLGGGISVGAHCKGEVIDVNNALDGDGPMSPERSGTVPLGKLYKSIFANEYTLEEIKKKNYGNGGLVAHLGTNDGLEVSKMIASGDEKAKFIFEALAYQISKEIASVSASLYGEVDAIIITGGLAHNDMLTGWIKNRVKFIAQVLIYPGEDELQALVEGTLRILDEEEKAMVY